MKQEIKKIILNGENFSNELVNYYTINRINIDGNFWIFIGDKMKKYNTINKAVNAILKLKNSGNL